MLAAVPPLVVWISLFLYMSKVEARLKSLEKEIGQ